MPDPALGPPKLGLLSKLAALLMALMLMASFYLYALMREDEQSKRSDQWVVAAEEGAFGPMGGLSTGDAGLLARAMGVALPLPEGLTAGEISDQSHHGYYARMLRATDGSMLVQGIRPASASAMLRDQRLHYRPSDRTLMGYPMLTAQDAQHAYYYLASEQAAFVIRLPLEGQEASLRALQIVSP